MANIKESHPENVLGPLFTDLSCIDCGTCYHLASEIFEQHEPDEKSVVIKQPQNKEEWQASKRAILSCPTNSIGVKDAPELFKNLPLGLPLLIEENVYYLGYTSRDSFGATSYLITRPEGNILVDSPRFHPFLVKELEKLGGVSLMVLSHQDDVADHKKFHEHFHCDRVIHEDDITSETKDCEKILSGEASIALDENFKVIMTPGHTKGHICFLYQDRYLFTGDHIFVDQDNHKLRSSKGVNWYSWEVQIQSVEKLLSEKFEWILPGHGGWGRFTGPEAEVKLKELLADMKGKA